MEYKLQFWTIHRNDEYKKRRVETEIPRKDLSKYTYKESTK